MYTLWFIIYVNVEKNYITLFTFNNVQKCVFIYIGQTKIKMSIKSPWKLA